MKYHGSLRYHDSLRCGCFLKWWYPQIIHFNRPFHINHPFWGTPIFENHHVLDGWFEIDVPIYWGWWLRCYPMSLAWSAGMCGWWYCWWVQKSGGLKHQLWLVVKYIPLFMFLLLFGGNFWSNSMLFGYSSDEWFMLSWWVDGSAGIYIYIYIWIDGIISIYLVKL